METRDWARRWPFATSVRALFSDGRFALGQPLSEHRCIRSTERLCKIHRDTILRHLVTVGEGRNRLHDVLMNGLQVNLLELDEVWSYLGKKQKRLQPEDPVDFGDQYVFT